MKVLFVCTTCEFLMIIVAPIVEDASSAPTEGGTVTISGSNFGNNPALLVVKVNSVDCGDLAILEDSVTLICTVSSGTGKDCSVVVTAAGQDSVSANKFSYLGMLDNLHFNYHY